MPQVDGMELLRFVRSHQELTDLPVVSEYVGHCLQCTMFQVKMPGHSLQCTVLLLTALPVLPMCTSSSLCNAGCPLAVPCSDERQ